jgi:hypothetical protein
MPRITHALPLGQYRLLLSFTDGTTGELDLRKHILDRGGVFTPLEDPAYFAQVTVDREAGTVTWPNGVDFCPDVLYSLTTGKPVTSLTAA